MKPIISIIIPTYNGRDYLEEVLFSVTGQLPLDCELIVVDDGSSDGTRDLLKSCIGAWPNVRIFFPEHRGVSGARNSGLDAARGKYVTFLDGDDCLAEGFFSDSLPLLKTDADLYIFSFDRVEFPEGIGGRKEVQPLLLQDRRYETASSFADNYIRNRHLLIYSACNKFYKKHILDAQGIRFRRDLSFGEDRLFNYDYLMCCSSIETSSIRMFHYMQRNPHSASNKDWPDYEAIIKMLHEAKMDCFLTLSQGTSKEEREAFVDYDRKTEKKRLEERSLLQVSRKTCAEKDRSSSGD